MGAAILAAYGLGWFKTIESCVEAFIKVDEVFEPNNENHDLYEQYYSVYEAIYKQTKQLTADLLTITIKILKTYRSLLMAMSLLL